MKKLKVLDLFSGIGGFSLGLEWTDAFETVAFCEIEQFPRKVLRKHWPEVKQYDDVRELTANILGRDGITVDVITGGFPCQDISVAGKRAGLDAETRSGLWSEIVRLTGELRPRYIIVENVANLLSGPSDQRGGWFGRILGDLAEIGYDAEWEVIPASAVGAPHRRDRVWIIAYPQLAPSTQAANARKERNERCRKTEIQGVPAFSWCENVRGIEDLRERSDLPQPLFRGSRDGVPNWMDRVGACGNAIVPQIAYLLGLQIIEYENQHEGTTD